MSKFKKNISFEYIMLDFSNSDQRLDFELYFLSNDLTKGEIELIEDLISWRRNPNNFEISGRGVKFDKKNRYLQS